jgi:hypothetical protein
VNYGLTLPLSFGTSRCEGFGQDLERDIPIQLRVARAIHLAHPASADRGEYLVWAEAGAGAKGHLRRLA